MSESPQAPGPSGATPWIAGICIVGAVALAIFAMTRTPAPGPNAQQCAPPPASDDLLRAFEGWGEANAGVRMVLQRDVEAWLGRWHAARQEACAKHEDHAPWTTCLDRQVARTTAVLGAIGTAEPSVRARAWRLGFELPAAEDCAHPSDAQAIEPERVAALDLAEGSWAAGRSDEARAQLDAIELADEDPLAPRTLWLRARLAPQDEATALLQRALWEAIAFDRPALATSIALDLAQATRDDPSAAQRWWGLASATARRLPTTPARQHALMHVQARLLHASGQPKAALSLYEVALTLIEREHSGRHPAMIDDLVASAHAAIALGELDAAEQLVQRALDVADGSLGARHVAARELLGEVSNALVEAGAAERAAGWLRILHERQDEQARGETWLARGRAHLAASQLDDARDAFHAASLWASAHEGSQSVQLQVELGNAAVARGKGEPAVAADHLARALEHVDAPAQRISIQLQRASLQADAGALDDATATIREALANVPEGDDASAGDVLAAAADLALRSERPAEALELARRAVASTVLGRGPADPSVVVALGHLGSACLALGRNDEAAVAFERAVDVAAAANLEPASRAATELAWASALWRTGAQEQARRVAQTAHARVANTDAAAPLAAWFEQRDLPIPAAG